MQDTTLWVLAQDEFKDVPIGFFGASTGSAAALIAAARLGPKVAAVVSRGGRPDLAGPVVLASLKAPTLLIVGGADHAVIALNEDAFMHMQCEKQMAIVPRATHLFEEPGALEQVCALASSWFTRHLKKTFHEEPAMAAGNTSLSGRGPVMHTSGESLR
jgi:pimeloyl-ACP methyl ester carboxylesterase